MIAVRVGRGAADASEVHHRLAGGQHLAHHRLGLPAVDSGEDLRHPAADVVRCGHAVHRRKGGVDLQEPQVGVEDRQPDRGACEQPVQQCAGAPRPPCLRGIDRQPEHAPSPAGVTGNGRQPRLQLDR